MGFENKNIDNLIKLIVNVCLFYFIHKKSPSKYFLTGFFEIV